MKVNGNTIKPGNVIEHKNGLWVATKTSHVKPGKGGAFVRTKLKDIQSGKVIDETFNSGHKLEFILVEAKPMQFLYSDDDFLVFMDNKTFEQIEIPKALAGEKYKLLKENSKPLKLEGQ